MQSSRRPKTLIEAERHSLEFTSGQLIIAICGLLFLWLVGFLMGVAAGRLEFGSSLAKTETPAAATQNAAKPGAKPSETAKATPPAKTATPAESKDKPRVADIPAPPAPKPAEPVAAEPKPAPAETASAEAKKPDSGVKFVNDRPDRPTQAATQTKAEAKAPDAAPAEAAKAAEPAPQPVQAAPAEEKPAPAKEETAQKPAEKPAEASKEEAPAKNELAKAGKAFTVQVFSVKAKNRSNAEEYVKLLKQNSGVTADIVKSKDGKHYNVVIGRYPDRKAAENQRDELKKKAGFADCMVREIGL